MLMKLTIEVNLTVGVNFINVLQLRFSYESKLSSFSLVTFGFVIFGAKISYKNARIKILMKLTSNESVVNFWPRSN